MTTLTASRLLVSGPSGDITPGCKCKWRPPPPLPTTCDSTTVGTSLDSAEYAVDYRQPPRPLPTGTSTQPSTVSPSHWIHFLHNVAAGVLQTLLSPRSLKATPPPAANELHLRDAFWMLWPPATGGEDGHRWLAVVASSWPCGHQLGRLLAAVL